MHIFLLVFDDKNDTINGNLNKTKVNVTLDPNMPPEPNITCPFIYSHNVYEKIDKDTVDDQIAIEDINSSTVRVYLWLPGLPSGYTELYNSTTFANRYINTRFKYIGGTLPGKLIIIEDNSYII